MAAQQAACFAETGFCISDAAILDFFQSHGGPNALGYPVSREFRLRGEAVQLFQRAGLRVGADGRAAALGLLDDSLLPLRSLNGSILPAPDPALLGRAPRADEPDYPLQAEAFLQAEVPDSFEGRPIGFLRAYLAAGGSGGAAATAADVFGWPTSRPTADPTSGELVYQRFQRALFQYGATDGPGQPLLLGDYLKSVLTGRELPAEIEADARGGPLLRQYNPAAADGLQRPWELPDTSLADAFRPFTAPAPRLLQPDGPSVEAGWPASSGADEAEVGPVEDGYLVTVDRPGTPDRAASAAVSNLRSLGDFVLVVDVRLADPGSAGYALHLRRQSDDERLTLLIDADRRLGSLYCRSGGETTVLWDWSPIPALRAASDTNRLMVRAVGQRVAAWANGTPLFDLDAPGPTRGSLWLAAVTWDQPARAIFSNLRLTAPD